MRVIGPFRNLRNIGFEACLCITVLCLAQSSPGAAGAGEGPIRGPRSLSIPYRTVVLGDSTDAYYGLAREIARREDAALLHSFDELSGAEPDFVLWVLSPGSFSDSLFTEFGSSIKEKPLHASLGIITGSTLLLARELYERPFRFTGALARVDMRENTIIVLNEGIEETVPLDASGLSEVLTGSEYVLFSGHGGGRYWKLDEETRFGADGIPPLPPLVAATGACGTFRPWVGGSIALAFTDGGAAAYAGFIHSPAPYYLMGHPDGFPMRHTWPGFTAGQVVKLQNAGSMKGFAALPVYYMLGDPRLVFSGEPPYRLAGESVAGGERTLTYENAPAGFMPVRIEGGAEYGFVEVAGVGSAGRRDYFYNGRLQTSSIGKDLLVLFEHGGGGFTIRLGRKPYPMRPLTDGFTDALDHAYIFLPSTNGTTFLLVVAACVLFGAIWFVMRKGMKVFMFREALIIGAGFALLKALYALARMDHISVVSYRCSFNPYFIIGSFMLTGCGTFFYLNVGSRLWKAASLLVATFPTWAVAGFWIAGITYINLFEASRRLGAGLYRYSIGLLPAIAFAAECLLLLAAIGLTLRIAGRAD